MQVVSLSALHLLGKQVKRLSDEGRVKEITLLGQNVNSYSDSQNAVTSHGQQLPSHDDPFGVYAEGFKSVYKPKREGVTFARLLDDVASVNREIRIRFTSPHPKDFSNEVCMRCLAKSRSETIVDFGKPAVCVCVCMFYFLKKQHCSRQHCRVIHLATTATPIISNIQTLIFSAKPGFGRHRLKSQCLQPFTYACSEWKHFLPRENGKGVFARSVPESGRDGKGNNSRSCSVK